MNSLLPALLALTAGAALSAQTAANARLGMLLRSSTAATGFAYLAGFVVVAAVIVVSRAPLPEATHVRAVPTYLWFVGGLLSAFGIGAFYWLIPQLGMARVIAFGLVGQIVFSLAASHFGWFGLPVAPVGAHRLAGAVALVVGVILIERG